MKPLLLARRPAVPSMFIGCTALPKRFVQALILVSAVGGLFGCGVQGTPRPPQLERPAKIADFTALQVGQSLDVHFTLPQLTTDGERLTKPLEVQILRALVSPDEGLAKLPPPAVWTHLIRQEWLPYAEGNSVTYSVHMTGQEFHDWRGRTLVVGVRTLTRGFRHRGIESDVSNLVDVPVFDVSEPLGSVRCVVTEKAVEVEFPAPTTTLSGAPVHDLSGYRVYRSSSGKPGSFNLLGKTVASPFRDTQFEFGHDYYYQVCAVFGPPGHLALSDTSLAVKVTPRDVFPPLPPQGLQGLYSAGAVELIWTANSEVDLAGYNVYRLEDQTAVRMNKELVRTPIFRDPSAPPRKTLTYFVTAVDLSGNESVGSKKEEVETK